MDFSILIPTYNRAKVLTETLDTFSKIEGGGVSWELIVIDNNSSDTTKAVCQKFGEKLPVIYIFEAVQGKNVALNEGIKKASGDVYIFTDDDVNVTKDWLLSIKESLKRWPEQKIFGGKIIPVFPEGTKKWVTDSAFSSYVYAIHDPYKEAQLYSGEKSPAGGNCWIRREIFDGGTKFDEHLGPKGDSRISGSELELFSRLKRKGYKFVYFPSAVVFHRIFKYQTKIKYILKRTYGSGRLNAFLPDAGAVKIFGIPRYYFRLLAEELFEIIKYLFTGRNCGPAFAKLALLFGAIVEYGKQSLKKQGKKETSK